MKSIHVNRLDVYRVSQLRLHRNAIIRASVARDGLPILLNVIRGVDPNDLINPISRALGYKSADNLGEFSQMAQQLKSKLEKAFLKYGSGIIVTLNGRKECFVAPAR